MVDVVSASDTCSSDSFPHAPTNMCELAKAFTSDMRIRPALDAIDYVRPYVKNLPEIAHMLPAIVVVGDQSSGKSSLLERLSGVNLPRGEGIVTRVPLELQLRHGPDFSARLEFQMEEDGDKICQELDADEVSDAIEAATRRIAGGGINIRNLPMTLRITGPDYQDLTLIDLPGIARVPLRGQPDNIEELTIEMILKYISGESKVILCSIPANNEFVTSAALKLAGKVDPAGLRTLGVVTKADQATRGIKRRLEGLEGPDVRPPKLGFVAIRCRTPEELDMGISLAEVRDREEILFESDPELKSVEAKCKGLPSLVDKLVEIQRDRLIEQLPRIVKQLDDIILEMEAKAEEYGDLVANEEQAFSRTHECIRDICDSFSGLATCQSLDPDTAMDVPAETFSMFEEFAREIETVTSGLLNPELFAEIKTLSERFRGAHLPNFLPHPVYHEIFKTKILDRLKDPANHLVQDVVTYVEDVLHKLVGRHLRNKYPKLVNLFCDQVSEFLNMQLAGAKFLIEESVESQSEFITFTPWYMEAMESFHTMVGHLTGQNGKDPKPPQPPKCFNKIFQDRNEATWFFQQLAASKNDNFSKGCLEMLFSLAAYAATVRLVITEDIPKKVKRCLVTKVCLREIGLENFLIEKFTAARSELFNLMHDSKQLGKRQEIQSKLENLRTARQKLRGIIGLKIQAKLRRHSCSRLSARMSFDRLHSAS